MPTRRRRARARGTTTTSFLGRWGEFDDAGDHEGALEWVRSQLPAIERRYGTGSAQFASAVALLSGALHNAGRHATEEYRAVVRRALDLEIARCGPDAPEVAMHLESLAGSLGSIANWADAEPLYRRRLRIWEAHDGGRGRKVAHCLQDVARACAALGRHAEAASHLERAIRVMEEAEGPRSPELPGLLEGLATVLQRQGAIERCTAACARIIAIEEHLYGPASVEVGASLIKYALGMKGERGANTALLESWLARGRGIVAAVPPERWPRWLQAAH